MKAILPVTYCGECTTGCDVGAFFSTPYFFLPSAEATKNLELRTNALAKNILVDENGQANGVAYIDRQHKAGSRSLWTRGGRRCIVHRVVPHPAEFEIAALATTELRTRAGKWDATFAIISTAIADAVTCPN